MRSFSLALVCTAITFAQGSSVLAQEPVAPAPESMALLDGLQAGTLGTGTAAATVAVALPLVGLVVLAATSDDDDSSG